MENASKALLIASVILIVLMVVGIGITFFYKGSNLTKIFNNDITDAKIEQHNNQFLMYDGKLTGQQIIELVIKAASNNIDNPEMKVEVMLGERGLIKFYENLTGEIISYISGSERSNDVRKKIYRGEIKYSNDGYINKIEINDFEFGNLSRGESR